MKTIDVAEATASLGTYARRSRREPVIVTHRGKPYAALTPLTHTDWENLAVSHNPKFQALIERSRASCPPGSGISSDEMRRRLGIETGRVKARKPATRKPARRKTR